MASLITGVCLLGMLVFGLCAKVDKPFIAHAGVMYNSRPFSSMLTVKNGEQFGNWTWPEMCPPDHLAVGFSLRVTETFPTYTDRKVLQITRCGLLSDFKLVL